MSDVTIDVLTKYWSWDSCPYTWDDATVAWDEAYDRLYTLNVSEGFNATDIAKKSPERQFGETFKASSLFAKTTSFNRNVFEVNKLLDAKSQSLTKKALVEFVVSENANKVASKKTNRVVKLSETKRSFGIDRSFAEDFGISETYWDNISYFISSAESFTISEKDNQRVRFDRTLVDYISLSEALSRFMINIINDGFVIKDKALRSTKYRHQANESFAIKELANRKYRIMVNDIVGTTEGFDQPKLAKGFYEKVAFDELFSVSLGINEIEQFKCTEDFSKTVNFQRTPLELLIVSDKQNNTVRALTFEACSLLDESRNYIGVKKEDGFNINEFEAKTINANILRTIDFSEKLSKNFNRPVQEFEFGIKDDFSKNSIHFLKFLNELSFADNCKNNIKAVSVTNIRLVDDFDRVVSYYRLLKDLVYISETYWDNILFYLCVLESCVVHEENDKAVFQNVVSRLNVGEVLQKDFTQGTHLEDFGLLDAVRLSKLYSRRIEESFGIEEQKLGSLIRNTISETIELKDRLTKLRYMYVKELLSCDDEVGRQVIYTAVIKEALQTIDEQHKTISRSLSDGLKVSDTIYKLFERVSLESLSTMDVLLREYIARRFVDETVSVEDYLIKGARCFMSEEMNTYDTLIKACEGILSNLSIKEGELTLDEFLEIVNKPPNYTKFIEFKVGEYDYKEALVRIVMATQVRQTKPMVANAVMHVDIPDTDDKGDIEISDTAVATKVYFNKFYYNPPTVNVTLKGGNTGDGVLIPNIVSTDKQDDVGRYFEVEIWDETWSERKTGRLSWVSKGY